MARNETKAFAKGAATFIAGGIVGVLADKIVGDALLATGIPNPQISSIQTHDAVLVAAELVGAYYADKKGKAAATKFLVGMATATVATDTFEAVNATGRWLGQPMVTSASLANGSQGRYNRTAPIVTNTWGGYLPKTYMRYPRR